MNDLGIILPAWSWRRHRFTGRFVAVLVLAIMLAACQTIGVEPQAAETEETVIVMSGRGRHRVGDVWYDVGPGDVIFVPRMTWHGAESVGDEDFVILWVLGGAASLDAAGYEPWAG